MRQTTMRTRTPTTTSTTHKGNFLVVSSRTTTWVVGGSVVVDVVFLDDMSLPQGHGLFVKKLSSKRIEEKRMYFCYTERKKQTNRVPEISRNGIGWYQM